MVYIYQGMLLLFHSSIVARMSNKISSEDETFKQFLDLLLQLAHVFETKKLSLTDCTSARVS